MIKWVCILENSFKENTEFFKQSTDNIEIVDKDGNNIDYQNLNKSDKEIVLTELLLQTAIQSMAEKKIVFV